MKVTSREAPAVAARPVGLAAWAALERRRRAVERVGRVMNAAAGWLFIAGALFVTFDVLGRRLVGVSSQATVEITGYLLATGLTWGLTEALASRAHIRVDVLVRRLPLGLRAWMHALALAFLAVLAFFLVWRGWALVYESWEFGARDSSAFSIPLVPPQGMWALGFTVFFVLTGLLLLEVLVLLALRRPDAVDRLLGPRTLEEETQEVLEAAQPAASGERR
jgi:TRAP-type C4-dicarboxylate transport system permease small subunit